MVGHRDNTNHLEPTFSRTLFSVFGKEWLKTFKTKRESRMNQTKHIHFILLYTHLNGLESDQEK